MNLFRLIQDAALHIFGSHRLLIWNLLSCFLYTSCSTQMRYGVVSDSHQHTTKEEISDSAMGDSSNINDLTKFSSTIKQYCKNPKKKTWKEIKGWIKMLSNNNEMKYYATEPENGDSLLGLIIRLHSDSTLSEKKKKYLFKKIIKIATSGCDYLKIRLLNHTNIQGDSLEYIAYRLNNEPMANMILKLKSPNRSKLESTIEWYVNPNVMGQNQTNLEHRITWLYYHDKFNNPKNIYDTLCSVITLHDNIISEKKKKKLEEVAKVLIRSTDPESLVNGSDGMLLHKIIKLGNLPMFKIFFPYNTNFTIKDENGNNLCHSMVNNLEIFQYVVKQIKEEEIPSSRIEEAFCDHRNKQGQTALDLLVEKLPNISSNEDSKRDKYTKCINHLYKNRKITATSCTSAA